MNEQKAEQALLEIADKLEKFLQEFRVSLYDTARDVKPKWYTPRQMTLNVLRTIAIVSPAEVQAVAVASYGAIDVLGFKGTVRLILELRRKHGGKTQGTVSRVRDGSRSNS